MKKTNTLSALIHAFSKVGKSTIGSSAPKPILVLDAEGGWRFIRRHNVAGRPLLIKHWDPFLEETPRRTAEDPVDVIIVTVDKWEVVPRVYQQLTQTQHDFQTVIIDSITELQRRCKTNLVGTEDMQRENWGRLLTVMDSVIRAYRDLVLIDAIPTKCVLFIAETRMDAKGVRQIPTMQGQISSSMPYWVDMIGYLFVEDQVDPSDVQKVIKTRRMLIGAHPLYESGNRLQGIVPDIIDSPDISQLFCQIYGDECQEAITA